MQVCELIELLEASDPAAEVHFAYNYGDHWRTQVAPAVKRVEALPVVYSDYHSMDRLADEDRDDCDRMVVVLRGR